ncbi:MAG: hypothetical protein JEY94_10990 [Melioribacteraceae bacterium]|nr:hypothetical protein [Melioribacteraceae bacterium]
MKNIIECSNCKSENPIYSSTCNNCKHYLRDRVYNIDLWNTFWMLMESPVSAFKKIIFSEHKNFVSLLLFFISLKVAINAVIVRNALFNNIILDSIPINIAAGMVLFIVLFILLVYGITGLNNLLGYANRFKDNLALYTYANSIFVFGLILLTTLKYALFGIYAFTFEPSPFELKTMAAWVITALEGLFFILAVIKSIQATFAQTTNTIYSTITGIVFVLLLVGIVTFLPVLIIG